MEWKKPTINKKEETSTVIGKIKGAVKSGKTKKKDKYWCRILLEFEGILVGTEKELNKCLQPLKEGDIVKITGAWTSRGDFFIRSIEKVPEGSSSGAQFSFPLSNLTLFSCEVGKIIDKQHYKLAEARIYLLLPYTDEKLLKRLENSILQPAYLLYHNRRLWLVGGKIIPRMKIEEGDENEQKV